MYGASRYRLETLCMDFSWKNSRRVFLAHLSRRLKDEIIVYQASRRLSVCLSVYIFKLKYLRNQWANRNQILSEASLGRGLIALGFGPGRIGALVSMATNSSHRVIMGRML